MNGKWQFPCTDRVCLSGLGLPCQNTTWKAGKKTIIHWCLNVVDALSSLASDNGSPGEHQSLDPGKRDPVDVTHCLHKISGQVIDANSLFCVDDHRMQDAFDTTFAVSISALTRVQCASPPWSAAINSRKMQPFHIQNVTMADQLQDGLSQTVIQTAVSMTSEREGWAIP